MGVSKTTSQPSGAGRGPVRSVALVGVLGAMLAVPGLARADFLWQSPALDLSAPGRNAVSPQVVTAPDGATTIAWYRYNDTGNAIVQAATRPAGAATFSNPTDLSFPTQSALHPQIAVDPDGATTVTWNAYNANAIVQVATRPAGAATFNNPVNLSTPGRDALNPQIAVDPDGATTITWQRSNGSNSIVQAATRPAGAATFNNPVDLSAPGQDAFDPQIAVAPDGATTVTWRRSNGSNFIVQAATRPAGAATFINPVDLSAPSQNAFGPQIAYAPDGATTITWYRGDNSGNAIVQATTRPAGAATFSNPTDLSAATRSAYSPQIATATDGTTTIAWARYNEGGNSIVQVASRLPGRTAFSSPTSLSTPGQDALAPQVATAADNSSTVTWRRYNESGNTIVQVASHVAPLTVTRSGDGLGTVTSTTGGIDCGPTCSAEFAPSARVTLTATAAIGSRFAGWTGSGCTGTGTCTLTTDDAKTIDASFAAAPTPAPATPVPGTPPSPTTDPTPGKPAATPTPSPTQTRRPLHPSKACRKAKKRLKKADTRKERKAAKKAVRRACH